MRPTLALGTLLLAAAVPLAGAAEPPVPPAAAPPPELAGSEALLFESVTAEARQLAAEDYREPDTALPEALAELGPRAYEDIRFRPEAALWRGEGSFQARLRPRGFVYRDRVRVHELADGELREIAFDPALFRYAGEAEHLAGRVPEDVGFAGLRLYFPLNHPERSDPVLGFLGASYFRVLARGQEAGLSARGLAVDTGVAEGEEFPRFTDFWLLRPAAEERSMTLLALLDSRSLTGAYRFHVRPGARTEVTVDARLFARADVDKLGVAPLTSMFLHGENTTRAVDDVRPEVHDSDGLMLLTGGGERVWRPLVNRPRLRISALRADAPAGFGLLQRDRDPESYLDRSARFQRRPSYWIEPLEGDWQAGSVELLEIPTLREINDNIVAYWRPESPPAAGESRHYRYRLTAFGAEHPDPLARVVRTRLGWAGNNHRASRRDGTGDDPPRDHRRVLVDFAGGDLAGLDPEQPVTADASAANAEIRNLSVTAVPESDVWRASFRLIPEGEDAADLRLHLRLRDEPLSETWNYVWYPEERP